MKTVKIHIHCTVCGWWVIYDLDVNEYGFFALHEAHCPDCLFILVQDIKKLPVDVEGGD